MIPRCPATKKIQYPSFKIADNALVEIITMAPSQRDHRRSRFAPTGVYQCEHCSYWHLTHCNVLSAQRRGKKNSRARKR